MGMMKGMTNIDDQDMKIGAEPEELGDDYREWLDKWHADEAWAQREWERMMERLEESPAKKVNLMDGKYARVEVEPIRAVPRLFSHHCSHCLHTEINDIGREYPCPNDGRGMAFVKQEKEEF